MNTYTGFGEFLRLTRCKAFEYTERQRFSSLWSNFRLVKSIPQGLKAALIVLGLCPG